MVKRDYVVFYAAAFSDCVEYIDSGHYIGNGHYEANSVVCDNLRLAHLVKCHVRYCHHLASVVRCRPSGVNFSKSFPLKPQGGLKPKLP